MFEHAEQGGKLSKEEYEKIVPELRVDLLNAQFDLREAPFSVLILVAGDDLWGCNEAVDLLEEWLDVRHLHTRVFLPPHETERPRFWPYWRELPPAGMIGLYVGAWPLRIIADRVNGHVKKKGFRRLVKHARRLEQELADDGTLVLKFWFHQPKQELASLIKRARKHPDRLWHVDEFDRRLYDVYDDAIGVARRFLEATHTDRCPWHVVESVDTRFRDVAVGRILRDAIRERLEHQAPRRSGVDWTEVPRRNALGSVNLGNALEHDDYRDRLESCQARLNALSRQARDRGLASVLVFEGWDAAGKGGVIRRITSAMAARDYRIVPVAAPTADEKAHHYLWRFWQHVPPPGRTVIFDRSWYGRVLVERVEGFAREHEWRRAYDEIRDFEENLTRHGIVLRKFWLHIDPDEQLRRFEARQGTPYKKHKITDEDYRNRARWDDYVAAVEDMIARTHTKRSPWRVVPANDKRWARIDVLETVCRALKQHL